MKPAPVVAMLPRCSRCNQYSALMTANAKGQLICHRCKRKRGAR